MSEVLSRKSGYRAKDRLLLGTRLRTDFCCCVMANLSSGMHLLLKNNINK